MPNAISQSKSFKKDVLSVAKSDKVVLKLLTDPVEKTPEREDGKRKLHITPKMMVVKSL